MIKDNFEFIVVVVSATVAATTFLITWLIKRYKHLDLEATEKSIGAAKVKEMENEFKKFKEDIKESVRKLEDDIEEVQRHYGECSKALEELKADVKDLMHRIQDAFFGRKRN